MAGQPSVGSSGGSCVTQAQKGFSVSVVPSRKDTGHTGQGTSACLRGGHTQLCNLLPATPADLCRPSRLWTVASICRPVTRLFCRPCNHFMPIGPFISPNSSFSELCSLLLPCAWAVVQTCPVPVTQARPARLSRERWCCPRPARPGRHFPSPPRTSPVTFARWPFPEHSSARRLCLCLCTVTGGLDGA